MDKLHIFSRALDHWGVHSQQIKCIEEMAELTQLLSKDANGFEVPKERIIEELIDVEIMIDQLLHDLTVNGSGLDVVTMRFLKLKALDEKLKDQGAYV